MSALDELREIDLEEITPLQAAIVFLSGKHPEDAAVAAEDLKTLQTELADYKKHADVVACTYCGYEIPKNAGMVPVLEHIATCEKRPEKAIFKRVFEINDMLIAWMEHVAGIGSPITIRLLNGGTHEIEPTPHYFTDCETCKEIAAYLQKYHTATE